MSELEKQQRDQYQLKRNKYIFIQKIILIVLSVILLFSILAYMKLDKDTYVYYAEEGNAIHRAYLNDNHFYEEEYLNGSHAYVSSLVEKMTVDFTYHLAFDTNRVEFKYKYYIDAQLEILDRDSKAPLYNPTYEILPLTVDSSVGNSLSIQKLVEIDFQKYNNLANEYVTTYDLKDTSSTLIVRMHVNVVGESEVFVNDRSGEYVTEVRIPLLKTAFKPEVTSTVPAGEQKILAINESIRKVFLVLSIVIGVLDVLAAGFLVFFVLSTRDKHIDYRRKVDRILKNYRSYIQKTMDPFLPEEYHTYHLDSISELLDIRDTLQKPILAHENQDQTCTRFFIVADMNLAYSFEIAVDQDELPEELEEPEAAPVEKTPEPPAPAPVEKKPVRATNTVEVINVQFPETDVNYKYDPAGEHVEAGDIVLVPTTDICRGVSVEREATVTKGNHWVNKSSLRYGLKKIIRVVKRGMQASLETKENSQND